MSVAMMTLVWQCPRLERHGDVLVCLALADFSDDNGVSYPSRESIAQKARMTGRNVRNVVASLTAAGLLSVEYNAGRNGVNVYRLNLAELRGEMVSRGEETISSEEGGNRFPGGRNGGSSEPSLDTSLSLRSRESARAREDAEASFAVFWETYGKAVDRKKSHAHWLRMTVTDRRAALEAVAAYVAATPELKYRKNPLTWLNGRCWEDSLPGHAPSRNGSTASEGGAGGASKGGRYDALIER